ncbi:MAG: hypothetical protein AB7H66_13005 [Hyphomonadaceae bacterium]
MFFAESLGPALTASSAAALANFVKDRLAHRSVSATELRATVAEFLRITNNSTSPDAVIKFLADRGVAIPEGANYKVAA